MLTGPRGLYPGGVIYIKVPGGAPSCTVRTNPAMVPPLTKAPVPLAGPLSFTKHNPLKFNTCMINAFGGTVPLKRVVGVLVVLVLIGTIALPSKDLPGTAVAAGAVYSGQLIEPLVFALQAVIAAA
jgi:hypothetical protein